MTATTTFDKLTGLPDLNGFQISLLKDLQTAPLPPNACILFFNIENFKLFNSTLGTAAGDNLLRFAGTAVRNAFPNDLAARTGEDHFVVYTCAPDIPDRIRKTHEQIRNYHPNLVMLTKCGVYEIQTGETYPLLLIDKARLACESCKGHFDQIYAYYDPHLSESLLTNKYIVDHIDRAIEQGHIKVYYQPLIRVLTGKLCGMEALARWDDPSYGLLSPASFISVLEHAHLIHRLDLFMAETVCRDLRQQLDRNEPVVPVSINLSRLDFDLCDVFGTIDDMIDRYELSPNLLDIEITESALSKAGGSLRTALIRFREHGYRIWIDDFGSEYSSLNNLKDYEFDVLKIDMGFLAGLDVKASASRTEKILQSIIHMARELGIQTLCEGVETETQFRFLRSSGCEIAQGYYFSKPVPLECLKTFGFQPESAEDARYINNVGRVNLLSTHPLGEGNEAGMNAGFMPMGLFEYCSDHVRTLVINTAFRQFLAPMNIQDASELDFKLDLSNNRLVERIMRSVERCVRLGTVESCDLVFAGDYCNLMMKAIDTNRETGISTVFVRAMNVSSAASYVSGGIKDKVLRSVYALFERVDILDLQSDRLLNVHKSRDRFRGNYENMPLQEAIREFARLNLHPEDRKRFLDLYNIRTLPDLLKSSSNSFNCALFRLHETEKTYGWQLMMQSLVKMDGREIIMSLACDGAGFDALNTSMLTADPAQLTGLPEGETEDILDSGIPKHLLFDTLMDSVNFGVFWKDKKRRFLSANRYFLDFYGFLSDKEIAGNTDEDMNWHVNPVPFMRDETDVLNGKSIYNAEGSCIVRGQDHKIVASKFPVRKGNEIIGLIGYFLDRGINSEEDSSLLVDELTGLLNSRGAIAAFSRYQRHYREYGTDFAIISIDINDFAQINHRYGTQTADEVLRKIAQVLTSTFGDNCVVSRIGGDEFVLLRQITDDSDPHYDAFDIASTVSSIRSFNGRPLSINVTVEVMRYSETVSIFRGSTPAGNPAE
ncbi:MAG: EAL domain-containing protein [Solobacterium sp.]|nr:EAL domain-containing protein [Solobacterium sp.]